MIISPLPRDRALRDTLARWSVDQWGRDYPGDTVRTYLDLYALADTDPDSLPIVLVATDDDGAPLGTASLVDDDELPGAPEPGPWLAAVFVRPESRGVGIGERLVAAIENEAARLGVAELFLYTPESEAWYEAKGWVSVRSADLHGRPVTVMCKAPGKRDSR